MCDNSLNTNAGSYTAEVSSTKNKATNSDILPIYQGIKIYPVRLGAYQHKNASSDFINIHITLSGESYVTYRDLPEPLIGKENTRYPKLGNNEIYNYYYMPLRDGWVYVVSKYAKGIYEYKHFNYKYHLERFYNQKMKEYPTNTLWTEYIQCADVDEVCILYSDVRLEEQFLRSRFFKNKKAYLSYGFSVSKWLKNAASESNIKMGKVLIKDLKVSVINDEDGENFEKIIDKICNQQTESKKKGNNRQDVFLLVDDVLGIGEQIKEDTQYKYAELQSFIKSIQTGIPFDNILERLADMDKEKLSKINQLPNKELFPDKDCSEAEYMHTTALLLKNFFYDMHIPRDKEDLKDYIDEGRGKINENTLNSILGINIRKKKCKEIDEFRGILDDYLKSSLFRNYSRFFLDKEEYPEVENENNLPFIVPEKYTYDFHKTGAVYNAMISQVTNLVREMFDTLSLSPYKADMYIVGKDPYQETIDKLVTLSGDKLEAYILLNKEVISKEYFEDEEVKKTYAFFQHKEFPFWESVYSFISAGNSYSEFLKKTILERKIPASIEWDLLQGSRKNNILSSRNKAEKGIRYSIVLENDGGLFVRVTDPKGNITSQQLQFPQSPDIQVTKTSRGANLKVLKGSYNKFTVTAEGTFILYIDLFPKANWSAVRNAGDIAKEIQLRSINIGKRILGSKCFGGAMSVLSFYLIAKSLSDPDRPAYRKANDVAMNLAILGSLTENFLPKVLTEGYTKNPFGKIKVYGKSFAARVPKHMIFRGFTVAANIFAGVEGVLQGWDLWDNGNTITGVMTGVLGGLLLFFSGLFLFGPLGWVAYLIITIVIAILMIIVSLFVDSDLELFLEKTIFHLDYNFHHLQKASLREQMSAAYIDIIALSAIKNKEISRKDKYRFMEKFQYQLDELSMIHLFAPTFQNIKVSSTYNMMRYMPAKDDTMGLYPDSMTISILGNLSLYTSLLEDVEFNVYMTTKSDPKKEHLEAGMLSNNIRGASEVLVINGELEHTFGALSMTKVKDLPGTIHYCFRVDANKTEKKYWDMETHPFFRNDSYYIFLYIRFRLKGGTWMPANRTAATHWLVYRYELKEDKPFLQDTPYYKGNYNVESTKISIKPMPGYENLK